MEKHRKVLDECVKKVLNEKRAAGHSNSLLDMLVADEKLNYEEVSATLVAFIVLGFDRLSTATCFALKELSRDKKTFNTIRQEIGDKRLNTFETLKSIKMLESFLSETHRLPTIFKHTTVGIPLNGFFIPPDTSVLLYVQGTGRDPQRLKNPDSCDASCKNLSVDGYQMDVPMMLTAVFICFFVRNYKFMDQPDNHETAITLMFDNGKPAKTLKGRK